MRIRGYPGGKGKNRFFFTFFTFQMILNNLDFEIFSVPNCLKLMINTKKTFVAFFP